MAPEKINLECISAFYDEIRQCNGLLKPNTFDMLKQYRNELQHIINNNLLKGEGHKAAVSLKSKIDAVYKKQFDKAKEIENLFS